ncbi:unnamed protein product [Acanthoscelides obtectus]|uniref:Uncharacterized protein n=1 Tax=Acanthoscelides obtectus TaxID=200917 RepID=A0A9P0JX02_ACAOB|nr:unnamed protein product [Acanthoscelides obtectus]CAK1633953.1 hypothetical protein AOBTE_LOCUS8505 [Acanthoscelides obtectus]
MKKNVIHAQRKRIHGLPVAVNSFRKTLNSLSSILKKKFYISSDSCTLSTLVSIGITKKKVGVILLRKNAEVPSSRSSLSSVKTKSDETYDVTYHFTKKPIHS